MKKIILLLVIIGISIGYNLYSGDFRFESEYSDILEILHHYGKTPVEITLYADNASCSGLTEAPQLCNNIKEIIRKNNLTFLIYSREKTENLLIGGPVSLRKGFSTSFLYSDHDYTEETQVTDLRDAIRKVQESRKQEFESFHFCQKLAYPHWFICANSFD